MKKIIITLIAFTLPIILLAQSGKKFILLEEFSTAPCGFCPDGDIIAEQLIKDYPHIIWITHHAGFGTDSMTIPESKTIASTFTTFAPGACIDRMDVPIPVYTKPPYIAISRQKWDSVSQAHLNDDAVVEISINNDYNKSTGKLTCKVDMYFSSTPDSGDIRLNLFISEDSVVGYGHGYDQKNYYNKTAGHPMYGRGDTVIGYVHHHVMRYVASGTWGLQGIIPNSPKQAESYTYTFENIPVSSLWKTKDVDVIAFVSYYDADAKKRSIINSNHLMLLDKATVSSPGINMEAKVNFYPNPASNYLYFDFNSQVDGFSQIKLYNVQGQLLRYYNQKIDKLNNKIELGNPENGLYFYSALGLDGRVYSGKLLVEN
ncbi:Omp28-related outer membrane protein [Bacteroidota bacterium]